MPEILNPWLAKPEELTDEAKLALGLLSTPAQMLLLAKRAYLDASHLLAVARIELGYCQHGSALHWKQSAKARVAHRTRVLCKTLDQLHIAQQRAA